MILIKNGKVYSNGRFQKRDLYVENGHFSHKGESDEMFDAEGRFIIPGFWDIHTHGAMCVDVNAADREGFERISTFLASHGVTRWLCSILTDDEERTTAAILRAREAIENPLPGAKLMGIHLEGPFLSPKFAGAMPPHLIIEGNVALMERYVKASGNNIRMMTLAPEVPGNLCVIKAFHKSIAFAMGHSDATYEEGLKAIEAGAVSITHTGNAMRLFHQHQPALFGVAMAEDVRCEMIADGLHLHPDTVRMYMKVKGGKKLLAISDSISAAGMPDGNYMLGINPVVVKNGDALLRDKNVRAGSTLTLDRAFRNIMAFSGESMAHCVPPMGPNQAEMLGFGKTYGSLSKGYVADFNVVDEKGNVEATFIEGKRI